MPFRFALFGLVAAAMPSSAGAQETGPPIGGPEDAAVAGELWDAIEKAGLVGPHAILAQPYEGTDPHGTILITLATEVSVNSRAADTLVKKNFAGDDISIESVATDPNQFLGSITVMFRRDAGYDADNLDWFWAKYNLDGSLQSNPMGMLLAGRGSRPKAVALPAT